MSLQKSFALAPASSLRPSGQNLIRRPEPRNRSTGGSSDSDKCVPEIPDSVMADHEQAARGQPCMHPSDARRPDAGRHLSPSSKMQLSFVPLVSRLIEKTIDTPGDLTAMRVVGSIHGNIGPVQADAFRTSSCPVPVDSRAERGGRPVATGRLPGSVLRPNAMY